jgi:F0F1-type ATP synthase assembly protein I
MEPKANNQFLLKYIGMAFQIMAMLAIATYIGYRVDKYLHTSPIGVIILSLATLSSILYKVYIDSTKKK